MYTRSTATLILIGLLSIGLFSAGPVLAQQTQTTTAQQPVIDPQTGMPVFRVSVVGRVAKAINFRPRGGETKIDFVGTNLMPKGRGDATVEGKDGYISIDANFESLGSPRQYGPEFLTFVLWAITPEGRTSNLGELQVSGDDGELKVTTELQSFGLVVTAEPYFAVTRPSNAVVMESAPRREGVFQDKTKGREETIDANYELLERGTYVLNQDPGRLKIKPLEPGAPLDLAEARNAVAIAQLAGADRYAADVFNKASGLLAEAEAARAKRKSGNTVQQPARQATQTAEDARLIAVKRMEAEYQARQRELAQQREDDARRREREALAQAQADRDRALAEQQRAAAEEARRLAAEQATLNADAARAAAEKARLDADAAAARLAQEREAAEAARLAAEQARAQTEAQARAAAQQAEREKAELRDRMRQQLNEVLETRESARGLIVNISDVLFDFDKASLKPAAREKLARVSGILLAQRGLNIAVEGHTDSVGSDSYNQGLSERRANSVRDYLVTQGMQQGAVATSGLGETNPVASNDTAAGRQRNRRVELIVSGDAITPSSTPAPTSTPQR